MEIKVIPATVKAMLPEEEAPVLRVAAYCRVSTLLEEQESSYESQIEHYSSFIQAHKGWILEGIYADEGISGTAVKKREEFNRMISRCMDGQIDLVITKSISRFARNTLDCIHYIRLLKERNIPVLFEKENINTMDGKGEVLITILASLAQQESLSISQNVRMGIHYQYQQGKVRLNYTRFLGYTKDADGNLIIVPEEAAIVQRIYKEFLSGKSPGSIARGLTEDGIHTCTGKTQWYDKTIRSILRNEKYIGDALLQKEYVTDYLTKKRSKNNGVLPQYYVQDNHPPIISRDDFALAQEEFARRRSSLLMMPGTSPYVLSGKLICGHCGGNYHRSKGKGHNGATIWCCKNRTHKKKCTGRIVLEEDVQAAVSETVRKVAKTDKTMPAIKDFTDIDIASVLEQIVVTPNGFRIRLIGKEEYDWHSM